MRGQLWSHFTMNLMAEGVGRKNANKLRCDHELWTANCRQITYLHCFLKLSDIPELKCILQKVLIESHPFASKIVGKKYKHLSQLMLLEVIMARKNQRITQIKKTHPKVRNELSTTYHPSRLSDRFQWHCLIHYYEAFLPKPLSSIFV